MARKYASSHNNSIHTYQFYKDRRYDPRWHQAFIEVRRQRRIEALLFIGCALIVFIVGIEFYGDNPVKNKINTTISHKIESIKSPDTSQSQSSQVQISSQTNNDTRNFESQNDNAENDSSSSTNSIENVQQALINQGYRIIPLLYDGEDTDQAMRENKAPQNLVHDGAELLLFKENDTVAVKGISGDFYPHDESYLVTEKTITIDSVGIAIPYQFQQDKLVFQDWTTKANDENGEHTITWRMEPYPDAAQIIQEAQARQKSANTPK